MDRDGLGAYGLAAERVQLWGAFAYVDGVNNTGAVSKASRGYLYFRLPDGGRDVDIANVKREWADLKSVAGTGQAVAFGHWGYIAAFSSLQPDRKTTAPSTIYHNLAGRNLTADMRVRPAEETPSAPVVYQTNIGVVKLSEQGNHADIVKKLKEALATR